MVAINSRVLAARAGLVGLSLVALFGCGRIGFDPLGLSAAQQDASPPDQDATLAQQDATPAQQDAAPLSITDPPSLEGIWSIQSITDLVDGGSQFFPRAVEGTGVLGEFSLISTGPLSFSFQASTIVLDAFEAQGFSATDGTLEIQTDGMWLLETATDDVAVISVSLSGDELSLVYESADPRNAGSLTPPLSSVIKLNPSFSATTEGDWDSLSLEYRDGDVFTPTNCVLQSAGDYERITISSSIDPLLRLSVTVRVTHFSDAACMAITSFDTEEWKGLAVETMNGYRMWLKEQSSSETAFWNGTFVFEGQNLRIDTISCLPLSTCLDLSENHLFAPAPTGPGG